jgi:hypothetical protein
VLHLTTAYMTSSSGDFDPNRYKWKDGEDRNKVSFEDAEREYASASKIDATRLMFFVVDNTNFSEAQKRKFLMRMVHEDKSLFNVYFAQLILEGRQQGTEHGAVKLPHMLPFSFEQIEEWWKQNESKFTK